MNRRGVVCSVLGLTACAAGAWWLLSGSGDDGDGDGAPSAHVPPTGAEGSAAGESAGLVGQRDAHPTEASPRAPDGGRTAVDAPASPDTTSGRLLVEVVAPDGSPSGGWLVAHETAHVPAFRPRLEPGSGLPRGARRVRIGTDGRAELNADLAAWIQLAAFTEAGLAHRFLAPDPPPAPRNSEPIRRVRLDVAPARRELEVFVVQPDLETPAALGRVRLQIARDGGRGTADDGLGSRMPGNETEGRAAPHDDPAEIGGGPIVTEVALDAAGHATIPLPDASSLVLAAGDANFEDPAPYTFRTALPRAPQPWSRAVTLVAPPPLGTVVLEFEVAPPSEDRELSRHTAFALTRLDDGSSRLHPVPVRPRIGRFAARLRIPAGSYRLETWPLGELRFPGDRHLRLEPGESVRRRFRAEPVEDRRSLRLAGLPAAAFPIHVLPRIGGGLVANAITGPFLGPYRWRTPVAETGPWPDGCRFAIAGNGGAWISTPVADTEQDAVCDVQPASLVEVRWLRPGASVTFAWVEIESSLGDELAPMLREPIPIEAGFEPGFVARFHLPRERLRVAVVAERSAEARPIWHETLDLSRHRHVYTVPQPD